MTITCKKLRFEEKFGETPDEFYILSKMFGCDKFNYIVSEDNFLEKCSKDLIENKILVGWPPEIEYTKICFSVGERVFYIHKKIEIK